MRKSELKKADVPKADSNGKSERRSRLLIVEDSESSRAMICEHLRQENFDITQAENGAVAVEQVKAARFDLVLMDIKMPMMDGYEAMRRIRQWEEARGLERTAIIAFTASAFEEDVQRALESGADLHLSKPVKREALAGAIKNLIGNQAETARARRSWG